MAISNYFGPSLQSSSSLIKRNGTSKRFCLYGLRIQSAWQSSHFALIKFNILRREEVVNTLVAVLDLVKHGDGTENATGYGD